jgi:hypothetical protein
MKVDEAKERFVHQGAGLERMVLTLACHIPFGDLPEFSLQDREQSVECGLVASTPGAEQAGDLLGLRRPHIISNCFGHPIPIL